jgi:hypothetical protein
MITLSGLFGGRTAEVPTGSPLQSMVRRSVTLHVTLTEGC